VSETGADVVSLGELGGGRATDKPVHVVLAVPQSSPWQRTEDLPEGVRISTEMPNLTARHLADHGVKAKVFASAGATEAKVPDIVDAIVDLTETGSSLRKAGLRIIDTLLTSRTELLAHRASYEDPVKRAAIDDVFLLLRSALRARGQVLLKLNVATADLDAVLEILPALSEPTILSMRNEASRAVESVVPRDGINTLIPALKAAGAHDILELPIRKIVE
jgi:ATP phosphoribosyltransferase